MMRSAKLKNEEAVNLLLIKEIEKYPVIYNNKLEEYSKQHIVDEAWGNVANSFDESVSELKVKYRNLRTVFIRKLKNGHNRKKYYLNDAMRFLVPYISCRKTTEEQKIRWALDEEEDENLIENYDDDQEEETLRTTSPPEFKPDTSDKRNGSLPPLSPKRRAIEVEDPLAIYPLDQPMAPDDCTAFGKSVGLELAMIKDPEQRDIAKKLISDAMFMAKMGKLSYYAHVQINQ